VSIDRDVLEAVREMDEHELRRLYILVKARLEGRGVDLPGSGPEVKLRMNCVGSTSSSRLASKGAVLICRDRAPRSSCGNRW